MKTTLLKAFILVFITGLFFSACGGIFGGCDCGKYKPFIDLAGIRKCENHRKELHCATCGPVIAEGDSVNLEDFGGVEIDMDYVTHSAKHTPHFSFFPAAYACDCAQDGDKGAKELLKRLVVTTKNDFNDQYKAGDTINQVIVFNFQDVKELTFPTKIYRNELQFSFLENPLAGRNFAVHIYLEFDNGEKYETDSPTIFLK